MDTKLSVRYSFPLGKLSNKIKVSYRHYLEGLLGLNDEISFCVNKNLFSYLKSCKQYQLSKPSLQQGTKLVTDTHEKADVHKQHFPSVLSAKELLFLSRLSKIKLQDKADGGMISKNQLEY